MQRWIPIRDAVDAGALSVLGSDWAVVPSVNPWIALPEAADMHTINAARQAYAADRPLSIELGKIADLIVIDRNIFEVPITTVHETQALMTLIDGEIVYEHAGTLAATA
jgi:predicted amidohydrolase YtcJ